uniref:Zinc finger, CCHC-type n=1 Tax=Tanacetum cinerariifolium TaxID=118510 RepID=A0A6L2MTF6_TANCI|nr:zinc finger, CCHC-type [Tanacetum cinerariifolium]
MVATAMKHMASSFVKLKKFEGVDFRIWQKKMHFMLSSMSVVYVLTTPMPKVGGENPTVEQVRKKAKWDNDDYVRRGLILNGMFDSLFDIYQNVETSKELWDTLEAKYMAEDVSSKKFLVRNFTNYKMTDSRQVLEQYNQLFGILRRFTQHKMNMDESIKEELTLVELDSHLRIEESLRAQENDKPKGNYIAGLSVVNMVEHNNSFRYNDHKGKRKHHDTRANPNKKPKVTCWKCRKPGHLKKDCKSGNVGNRANGSSTKGSKDGFSNPLKDQSMFNKSHQIYYVTYVSETFFVQDDDVAWWVDSRATMHVCKDRCWFKTYESLNDGSILHMRNESTALVHRRGCVDLRLCHVHFKMMQDMSKDGLIPAIDMDTESNLRDLHATPSLGNKKYFVTFIDDAYRAAVRLPKQKLKTLGERGIECIFVGYVEHSKAYRFYVIEPNDSVAINSIIESRDAIFDNHRFSSIHRPSQRSLDNPKTFDEAMKSQDVAFWKEAINGEMDFIVENNTWVLTDLPPGCRPLGCKWNYKRKLNVDGTVKKFKASHGDVCLGWGRWGEFVGGHGSGGDGLESGGSGVMGDGGKSGLGMNTIGMFVGAGEGGRDEGESWVSDGVGWKVERVGLWSLAAKTVWCEQ